jgi:hypothetical protein
MIEARSPLFTFGYPRLIVFGATHRAKVPAVQADERPLRVICEVGSDFVRQASSIQSCSRKKHRARCYERETGQGEGKPS